jgi:hypothetical protein
LPSALERACEALYVNREVLQFCDFYCATLSFWITIISLAKLPHRLVNFLHILGVLLVAVLVQGGYLPSFISFFTLEKSYLIFTNLYFSVVVILLYDKIDFLILAEALLYYYLHKPIDTQAI